MVPVELGWRGRGPRNRWHLRRLALGEKGETEFLTQLPESAGLRSSCPLSRPSRVLLCLLHNARQFESCCGKFKASVKASREEGRLD